MIKIFVMPLTAVIFLLLIAFLATKPTWDKWDKFTKETACLEATFNKKDYPRDIIINCEKLLSKNKEQRKQERIQHNIEVIGNE